MIPGMQETLEAKRRDIQSLKTENANLRNWELDTQEAQSALEREKKKLEFENARTHDELESLKAMFARRIARDQVKFEERIRQKDEACESWLKTRTTDIKNMQQTLFIMQHIFRCRKQKFVEQAEERQLELENARQSFEAEAQRLREEVELEKKAIEREKREMIEKYEGLVEDQKRSRREAEERADELEHQLADVRAQVRRLESERDEVLRKEAELKQKLVEVDTNKGLLDGCTTSREEQLEIELRKMRKLAHARTTNDADALKQELDEYARFVVKLIPNAAALAQRGGPTPSTGLPSPSSPSPTYTNLSRATSPKADLNKVLAFGRQRRTAQLERAYVGNCITSVYS